MENFHDLLGLYKVLQQIRNTYPDLDINWLLSDGLPNSYEEMIASTHF